MAPNTSQVAVDFTSMINADRQRRKNEALAQQIFGKNRRSSAPGAKIENRKPGAGPSLASRVGITKRSASTSTKPAKLNSRPSVGNVDAEWTHDLHPLNNPTASPTSVPRGPRGANRLQSKRSDRLHTALNGSASSPALNSQFNLVSTPKPSTTMTIRGLAGPYVVMAKNFALGTTSADIESAMTPVGGIALSCRIITERPSVIAEIIFESKEGADNVVATFNNQNADGNLLHVYHKVGGTVRSLAATQPAPIIPVGRSVTPLGPRADAFNDRSDDGRSGYGNSGRYAPRERSLERSHDRRRDYNSREDVVDGSYGFDDHMDTDDRDTSRGRGGLYSDTLVGNTGRGRGNSRDRGRGSDRVRGYR